MELAFLVVGAGYAVALVAAALVLSFVPSAAKRNDVEVVPLEELAPELFDRQG